MDSTVTTISHVHPEILRVHILSRMDGPTLGSVSCTSSAINSLAYDEELWSSICRSSWPSTSSPIVRSVISSLCGGARAFFSSSFLLLSPSSSTYTDASCDGYGSELVSAVDLYYKKNLVFSKVVVAETASRWFCCSPFRIDMLDPSGSLSITLPRKDTDNYSRKLSEDLTMSWILIDPFSKQIRNISNHLPISVQRHWLNGELHARFGSVVKRNTRSPSPQGAVHLEILVSLNVNERAGDMVVKEVSLQVEDLDGKFLSGEDSLVILQEALDARNGIKPTTLSIQARRNLYEEFSEMKMQWRETNLRKEVALDMLCVSFGIAMFATIVLLVLI